MPALKETPAGLARHGNEGAAPASRVLPSRLHGRPGPPAVAAPPADVAGTPSAAASDAALLAAIATRDERALAALYDRHGGPAYRLAYRLLRDRAAAETVVEGVFLQAWRAAATFQGERGSVRAWLLLLTHHRATAAGNAATVRA